MRIWLALCVLAIGCDDNKTTSPADLAMAMELDDLSAPVDQSGIDQGNVDLTESPDLTNLKVAPAVIAVRPVDRSLSVGLRPTISVTFSTSMDTTATTLQLSPAATAGAIAWSGGDTVATLPLTADLAATTQYTLTVSGQDKTGTALATVHTVFTTLTPDTTAPTVTSTTPANAATGVSITPTVSIQFSEPMDIGTVSVTGLPMSGAWSVDQTRLDLTLFSYHVNFPLPGHDVVFPLRYATGYSFTVAGKDLSGNALGGTQTFTFTTADAPFPTISYVLPADKRTNVSAGTAFIAIQFDRAMDTSSVACNGASPNLTLKKTSDNTPVTLAAVSWGGNSAATCFGTGAGGVLLAGTQYTATLATGAKDASGHALQPSTKTWTFTVGGTADLTAPTGTVTPTGANVAVSQDVIVSFSEAIDVQSFGSAMTVSTASGPVTGFISWSSDAKTVTFTPDAAFNHKTQYTVHVATGAAGCNNCVRDGAGNPMAAAIDSTFTTINSKTVDLTLTTDRYGFVGDVPADGTSSFKNANPIAVGWFNEYDGPDDAANLACFLTTGMACFFSKNVNVVNRAVLSFKLPPGNISAITSATLYVDVSSYLGDPTVLGKLFATSVVEGDQAFDGVTFDNPATNFTPSPTLENQLPHAGLHVGGVLAKVQNDLVNRAAQGDYLDFRLRFENEQVGPTPTTTNTGTGFYIDAKSGKTILRVSYETTDP